MKILKKKIVEAKESVTKEIVILAMDFKYSQRRDIEDRLYKVQDSIRNHQDRGKPVPQYLIDQERTLKRQLEEIEREISDLNKSD